MSAAKNQSGVDSSWVVLCKGERGGTVKVVGPFEDSTRAWDWADENWRDPVEIRRVLPR